MRGLCATKLRWVREMNGNICFLTSYYLSEFYGSINDLRFIDPNLTVLSVTSTILLVCAAQTYSSSGSVSVWGT